MLNFIESILRFIASQIQLLTDKINGFIFWFESNYPLTWRLIMTLVALMIASVPFIIAFIQVSRDHLDS